jgi:putative nucleotidyltransferase with HDIG domain
MNNHRILIVSGDDSRTRSLVSFLSGLDLEIERTTSCPKPSSLAGPHARFSLLILPASSRRDQEIAFLRDLKKTDPCFPVVMLSNPAEPHPLISLLQESLIDQVSSPDNYAGIYSAVRNGLARKQLTVENEYCMKSLTKLRLEQSRNIRKTLELEEIYNATLENLMTALDLRDVETFGHSMTVAKYSQVLAGILGIEDKRVLDNIRKGALLHDVGKIAIPDSILKKPGPLTAQEWEKIRLHPSLGYGLVKEIKLVKEAGNIILYHHEKVDGTGYPEALQKREIPLEARVFALADALDAITSHRPYRRERDFSTAGQEIRKHAGSQFDPRVVDAFGKLPLERWEKIRYETTRLLPSIMEYHSLVTKK